MKFKTILNICNFIAIFVILELCIIEKQPIAIFVLLILTTQLLFYEIERRGKW